MGIKKILKIKPPEEETPEQNRDTLMELGITTKNKLKHKKEKFAAYGMFAKDKGEDKVFAPPGYEQYATPEEELNDLNESPVDLEKDSEHKHKKIPKLHLFKKKKHHNHEHDSLASPNSNKSDPYAVNPEARNYFEDPYSTFNDTEPGNNYTPLVNPERVRKELNPPVDPYTNPGSHFQKHEESTSPSSLPRTPLGSPTIPKNERAINLTPMSPPSSSNISNIPSPSPHKISSPPVRLPPPASRTPVRTNPYENMSLTPTPYVKTNSTSTENPYATMTADSYGMNPGSIAPTAGSDNMERTVTADLNESKLHLLGDDRFDFEDQYEPIKEEDANAVTLDDLNATVDDRGDDLNAEPTWQIQEEETVPLTAPQQTQEQDYNYYEEPRVVPPQEQNVGRGYQTFEEVQREEEARQQQDEDEAVDELKQNIKFTKQSSVASTRNTLKMAQEAEMSGMNTLGILGHQSEQLNNVEGNLDLIKIQNSVAEDKVDELKKLNRNVLAIHAKNPFNAKRRRMEHEDELKARRLEEQAMLQATNQQIANSTQRISNALTENSKPSLIQEKYKRQEVLNRAKKYQFENDEEDDDMEVEIDRNLDQVQQISGRLKKLAISTGEELDSQQERLKDVEENTDNLDIKLA